MLNLVVEAWPLLLVGAVLLLTFGLGRVLLPDEDLPYEKRPSLVNDGEHACWRSLMEAAQQRWTICPLVRMADVIRVRPQTRKSQAWQSRLNSRYFDFVLCDPASLEAKLVVTLEDEPAPESTASKADDFLTSVLAAAKLPLLRVQRSTQYSADELRSAIHQLLGIETAAGRKSR